MKCLVFSDSHGDTYNMRRALRLHPDAEVVFFLGDGLDDADIIARDSCERAWLVAAGNCDTSRIFRDAFVPKTDGRCLEGHRIVFTHGDLYGAKYGDDGLIGLAGQLSAELILFGHTHRPTERYVATDEGGVYLFNPGSIASGSYGIVMLSEQGILLSHGKI